MIKGNRMLDAIKPLLESGVINEAVGEQINEAWEAKLDEARNQVRAELHEEFAQRYEHDRSVMVEALDKMMSESLSEEISEFHEERKAMNEERVKAQVKLRENATKFNDFMVSKLAEEIQELRNDRKLQMENQKKLESFITHALAREIKEFAQDRREVVEAKVKLVAEGKKQLETLKRKFVKENSKKVSATIGKHLESELSQLKEDIQIARENTFGRKIFESFASEFSVSYLNDKVETRNLMNDLDRKNEQLEEAAIKLTRAMKIVENKDREVRMIKESNQRKEQLGKLLSPLNAEKKEVMSALLESVQTDRLENAFEKYLPAVLNNVSLNEAKPSKKAALTESKVVTEATGDKSAKKNEEVDPASKDNVIDIKRLAGL